MAGLLDEDEDLLAQQQAPAQPAPVQPVNPLNVPLTPEKRKILTDFYMNKLMAPQAETPEKGPSNSFFDLLAKASAGAGSIGGKVADTSGLSQQTAELDAQRAKGDEMSNKRYLQSQKGAERGLEKLNAQSAVATVKPEDDPNSTLSQTMRARILQDFPKLAKTTPNFDNLSWKTLNEAFKVTGQKVKQDEVDQKQRDSAAARSDAVTTKADANLQKQRENFGKEIQGSVKTELGVNRNKINAAEKVTELIADFPNGGDIPPQYMAELAMGMANLITPGQVTEAQIHAMDPQSMNRYIAELTQKFTGEPVGAGMPGFVDLMKRSVAREKGVAQDQIRRRVATILRDYPDLSKKDPKYVQLKLQDEGIDPSMLTADNSYIPQVIGKPPGHQLPGEKPGAGTAIAASQKGPPVGTVEDGHRFLGGDPRDPKSWEEVK